jgi:hypothetical protein
VAALQIALLADSHVLESVGELGLLVNQRPVGGVEQAEKRAAERASARTIAFIFMTFSFSADQ